MIEHTPVYNIMTRKPVTVSVQDAFSFVRRIFEQMGFHHVPVTDNGKLVGIISYTDYLRIIEMLLLQKESGQDIEQRFNNLKVADVMTTEVVTILESETVERAIEIFKTHNFHAAPVVDRQGHLTGILSTNDLLGVLEQEFLRIAR